MTFIGFIAANQASSSPLIYILLALLGGGGITAVVTWLRFKQQGPVERDSIVVEASERAVSLVTNALATAETDSKRLSGRVASLEVELLKAKKRIAVLEIQLKESVNGKHGLTKEVEKLRRRIAELDAYYGTLPQPPREGQSTVAETAEQLGIRRKQEENW